ncbi:aminodeoxychorismate/anthranilate synthase component II (plasmid) [Nicoliella spurrieriana]|uniref:Aminodeoxychorismate/anthranilate synthase component II n=1 Tax=Nicoliella spurrieriana TaxID=2925830 RepID=A0A976X4R4_9LACO|nr:aminodeoxychorismate/anthranilate synthase component II [Nicoliella spurrieriana]UQS86009.1 aminodeoxychorismate/anthranilate synthase component II [Nicoliella spurrieriana]
MILLIDNYDSFTYNLFQEIGNLTDQPIEVVKNDQVSVSDLNRPGLTGLVLSPGPGRPEDAGNMNAVLKAAIGKVPVLGVCLGHQAIGEVYGAQVIKAPRLMHGKTDTMIKVADSQLFDGCPDHFTIGRYHSLVIDPKTIPTELTVTGMAADGTVQAVADPKNEVFGVEYHPESIMTDQTVAKRIFNNFLALTVAKQTELIK